MELKPISDKLYSFQGPSVTPTGTTPAVIWHAEVRDETGGYIQHGTATKVDAKFLKSHAEFRISPLSEKLGIPLGSCPVACYTTGPQAAVQQSTGSSNTFANYIHARIDPDDLSTFSYRPPAPLGCDVLFMRLDGGHLDANEMQALCQFCCSQKHLLEFRDKMPTHPDPKALARETLAKYTPKAFADFFEWYRQFCIAQGISAWKDTECPVLGLCGDCREGGDKLVVCSKCKRRKYCGKTCQTEDWARHKKACKKAV